MGNHDPLHREGLGGLVPDKAVAVAIDGTETGGILCNAPEPEIKDDEAPVSWEEILEVFKANVGNVTQLLVDTIPKLK